MVFFVVGGTLISFNMLFFFGNFDFFQHGQKFVLYEVDKKKRVV